MRTFFALILTLFSVCATATDWYVLDYWDVPEIPGDPENPDDYSHAFGLAYRDSEIYVSHWNSNELYPDPPFLTNLWVYDMDGDYQGKHFPSDITDIDTGCVDWKADSDHGGTGWYMGNRRGVEVFFVADNGSSYTSFPGPSNFSERIYGVAHNPDNDVLYVSNWVNESGRIAWGSIDGSGHVTSWTQEDPGFPYNALKYVSVGGASYFLAQYRGLEGSWDNTLHVFSLNSSGIPNDIYVPDEIIDYDEEFFYPGDISWDGDNFWMLDQNRLNDDGSDWPTEIALPGFSSYTVNITPASFGNIKAQFR
jgi:hypothetical protein